MITFMKPAEATTVSSGTTTRYAVLDMLGAVRMGGKIDEGASVDIQGLPSGYYVLRLLTADNTPYILKFIKS